MSEVNKQQVKNWLIYLLIIAAALFGISQCSAKDRAREEAAEQEALEEAYQEGYNAGYNDMIEQGQKEWAEFEKSSSDFGYVPIDNIRDYGFVHEDVVSELVWHSYYLGYLRGQHGVYDEDILGWTYNDIPWLLEEMGGWAPE